MIRFILLQNRQGKTRLSKWYGSYSIQEKYQLQNEVHRIITNRSPKFTSFVEYGNGKIIYRRYAGLYFSLYVDVNDNELAYLEIIHFFVELLDQYFGNVCELDLVFEFHKVYMMLDEVFLSGEIQETNRQSIRLQLQKLEESE